MISVIIPAYNAAGFIEAALQSVADQGRNDIEVIVVDDASTDDTVRVVENSVSSVRLLQQSANGGPAAARNRGMEEARGEWIAFLDADDRWLPGKLELQLRFAEENPEFALWCSRLSEDAKEEESFYEVQMEDFITRNPIATSTVLLRKEAMADMHGFDERFIGAEDYDLWVRLVASGGCRAAKIKKRLSAYRSEAGSLSMDERKFLPDSLAVLEKAFGVGGALEGFADRKSLALANQYWNASWMAFERGARGDAIRLWRKGHKLAGRQLKRPWWRLLIRYLVGRK